MDIRLDMQLVVLLCLFPIYAAVPAEFKAAVVEHVETSAHVNTTDKALEIMLKNLNALEASVKEASRQGSQIILFPEYGITGGMPDIHGGRPTVYPYAIQVPPAGTIISNLSQSVNSVLLRLAMMAQKYQLYIVANLIERVDCDIEDKWCPSDGHFQFNTNLVFAKNRTLVAKFHKFHLWKEENVRLDSAPIPEYVWFDTEFGRVGTLICYDVEFYDPAIILVEKYGVDHIAFTTYWDVEKVFLFSNTIQFTFGFARRMNVNFLASNIHNTTAYAFGSHISTPQVVVNSTYNRMNHYSEVLLTATLSSKQSIPQSNPGDCSTESFPLGNITKIHLQELEMNMTKLMGFSGKTSVCFNKFCCNLNFERNDTKELFILSVFEGMIPDYYPNYNNELCMVSKCQNSSLSSCDTRDDSSHTLFTTFEMHAQFRSEYVSPSWTGAQHTYSGIEWEFTHSKKCNMIRASETGVPLLSATLLGYQ